MKALAVIYFILSQIFSIIFFVDICKEWDSWVAIIFVGPIWAEIKGLLWIISVWFL